MTDDKAELSLILEGINRGQAGAQDRLFRIVYDELHRMAHGRMIRESQEQTLQTTALVHEAYLRLFKDESSAWENRRHFFGAAARSMRQILIDRAKHRQAERHGGGARPVTLEEHMCQEAPSMDMLALDRALDRMEEQFPRHAEVVKYRYFLGLTVQEVAKVLQVAPRTVDTHWQFAKSWLRREVGTETEEGGDGR